MHKLFLFVLPHWIGLLFAGWWIFSAAVDGMPAPSACSGFAYRWAYLSCHLFAANVARALRARFPGEPIPDECPPDSPQSAPQSDSSGH